MLLLTEILNAVAHGLEVGAIFFYKALWSILFGVSVTAAIDVLVDKERMARFLGGRDLRATGKATMLGAASSACTFGAVSIAQTLFKKGASAESTFAFALASTNIVFELGILIYVLMGWQFLAAELLSGFVLVAVMYLLVQATLPVRVFELARRRLQEQEGEAALPPAPTLPAAPAPERPGWREQLKEKDVWYRIAVRYFKTLRRIYKSVVFGFLIAGFIVAWVPASVWTTLFIAPSTFLGALENVAMGVVAGIFSFIGSIGIVPFAAALWIGGVSFGGAVGAIVSDLITVPVLNLWKEFMGWKATAYIFAVFYIAMVTSALAMEYLFRALRAIPSRPPVSQLLHVQFRVDYTLVVTVVFLAIVATLYLIKHRGDTQALGGGVVRRLGPATPGR